MFLGLFSFVNSSYNLNRKSSQNQSFHSLSSFDVETILSPKLLGGTEMELLAMCNEKYLWPVAQIA